MAMSLFSRLLTVVVAMVTCGSVARNPASNKINFMKSPSRDFVIYMLLLMYAFMANYIKNQVFIWLGRSSCRRFGKFNDIFSHAFGGENQRFQIKEIQDISVEKNLDLGSEAVLRFFTPEDNSFGDHG